MVSNLYTTKVQRNTRKAPLSPWFPITYGVDRTGLRGEGCQMRFDDDAVVTTELQVLIESAKELLNTFRPDFE